ncbi:MAG: hypothetical protein NVS2B7_12990 [Herpetosiphon sp.]
MSRVQPDLPVGTPLLNLGIRGAILLDLLVDQVPIVINAYRGWLMIWPAINDIRAGAEVQCFAADVEQDLLNWYHRQRQDAVPHIRVVNIPDLRSVPAFDRLERDKLETNILHENGEYLRVILGVPGDEVRYCASWPDTG